MSYEFTALLMFVSMLVFLLTGRHFFLTIGAVAAIFSVALWGRGGQEMPFKSALTLMEWYPLLTLPLFIYMGHMFSKSGIADDLYRMFHVWSGSLKGGLAIVEWRLELLSPYQR